MSGSLTTLPLSCQNRSRLATCCAAPKRRCHVNSDATGGHVDRLHDFALRQLQAPSVSAWDHRACGVLYFRFPLSLPLVEQMLQERGIVVSYETVRRWAMKFGRDYARRLKRKRASRRDIWHLDEGVPRKHQQQWGCGAA